MQAAAAAPYTHTSREYKQLGTAGCQRKQHPKAPWPEVRVGTAVRKAQGLSFPPSLRSKIQHQEPAKTCQANSPSSGSVQLTPGKLGEVTATPRAPLCAVLKYDPLASWQEAVGVPAPPGHLLRLQKLIF